MAEHVHAEWGDGPGIMAACVLCEKPTRSHGLYVLVERDSGVDLPVGTLCVCHTCYEAHDGDATAAMEAADEANPGVIPDVRTPETGDGDTNNTDDTTEEETET